MISSFGLLKRRQGQGQEATPTSSRYRQLGGDTQRVLERAAVGLALADNVERGAGAFRPSVSDHIWTLKEIAKLAD